MKFIHIADVHLGVVPDAGKSWSEKRAADIWTTFTEVFAVAKKIKVDMVLIAGDLFHRQPLIREIMIFCRWRQITGHFPLQKM